MRKKSRNRIHILITCAGGSAPIYLARKLSRRYDVFLADASADHAGRYIGFPCTHIPLGTDPSYQKAMSTLIKKHNIQFVVPGADEEILPLIKAVDTNVAVIAPNPQFSALCVNKKRLMSDLHKNKLSHLPPFRSIKSVTFPAIIKPIRGHGSREVHRVDTRRQLKGYLDLYKKKFGQVVVQEYVRGTEYSISVVLNNKNKIIGIVPKKILLKRGITRAAVTERNAVIDNICRRIVEQYKPAGPFNVQLKIHNGKPYIFEINPRLSTTAVLTDRAFGNEVDLYIRHFGKDRIHNPPRMKAPVFLFRYDENIFK